MVAHLVLLAPRAGLTAVERDAVVSALEDAARAIPSVRRVQVGRRVRHGAAYEARMAVDFPLAAIFEFDDLAGLQAYLAHPAHDALGARFYDLFSAALAYDFELGGVAGVRDWLGREM